MDRKDREELKSYGFSNEEILRIDMVDEAHAFNILHWSGWIIPYQIWMFMIEWIALHCNMKCVIHLRNMCRRVANN